jgi:uncharacterized lipoprotein NlpE involved in copper resistance
MFRAPIQSLLLLALVAGCGNEDGNRSAVNLAPESLPGAYSGTFPCDGCAGIPTTLWLRSDGRFFFRQSYQSDAASTVDDVYSLGRWNLSADRGAIELRGAGPVRVFLRPDRDALIMRTASDQEHRLTRDPGASEFSATMRLSGMTRKLGNDVTFTECLTGLHAPVSKGGDFPSLWHQVRSVGGLREPVYVEFDGRFTWDGDGAPQFVRIQKFVTVRADATC